MGNSSIEWLVVQGIGEGKGEAGGVAALRSSGGTPALDLTTVHIPPSGTELGDIGPNSVTVVPGIDTEVDNSGFFLPLGGGMVKLKGKAKPGAVPPGGPREKVRGLSAASRKRLLQKMAAIDRGSRPPLFVGLTYPGDRWPDDPAEWHGALEAFWKRLQRYFPALRLSMFWRLEPQHRGAPHFHLLIFGVEYLPYRWVADNWSAILGGDEAHRRSCSRVERVKSWRGAMSYASKYLGKLNDGTGFTDIVGSPLLEVGRHWGVKGKQYLPVNWVRYIVGLRAFHQIRRTIAKYMRSKGRHHKVRGRYAGVWCFMDADEALRLVGLFEPEAEMVFQVPQL